MLCKTAYEYGNKYKTISVPERHTVRRTQAYSEEHVSAVSGQPGPAHRSDHEHSTRTLYTT